MTHTREGVHLPCTYQRETLSERPIRQPLNRLIIPGLSRGGAGKARFNVATPTYEARLVRDRYMYSIRITV